MLFSVFGVPETIISETRLGYRYIHVSFYPGFTVEPFTLLSERYLYNYLVSMCVLIIRYIAFTSAHNQQRGKERTTRESNISVKGGRSLVLARFEGILSNRYDRA
jgi:hypothetical protein